MGCCVSLLYKSDHTGPTFSHYSLNSESEHLDLYPGFRYVETDDSIYGDDTSTWRRSSVPLLDTRPQDSMSVSNSMSLHNTPDTPYEDTKTAVNTKPFLVWDRGIGK